MLKYAKSVFWISMTYFFWIYLSEKYTSNFIKNLGSIGFSESKWMELFLFVNFYIVNEHGARQRRVSISRTNKIPANC